MDSWSRAPSSSSHGLADSTDQPTKPSALQSRTTPTGPTPGTPKPHGEGPLSHDIATTSQAPVVAEIHTLIARFSLFISLLANATQVAFLAHYPRALPNRSPEGQRSQYLYALVHAEVSVSDRQEVPHVTMLSINTVKERMVKSGFHLMIRIHDDGDNELQRPSLPGSGLTLDVSRTPSGTNAADLKLILSSYHGFDVAAAALLELVAAFMTPILSPELVDQIRPPSDWILARPSPSTSGSSEESISNCRQEVDIVGMSSHLELYALFMSWI